MFVSYAVGIATCRNGLSKDYGLPSFTLNQMFQKNWCIPLLSFFVKSWLWKVFLRFFINSWVKKRLLPFGGRYSSIIRLLSTLITTFRVIRRLVSRLLLYLYGE